MCDPRAAVHYTWTLTCGHLQDDRIADLQSADRDCLDRVLGTCLQPREVDRVGVVGVASVHWLQAGQLQQGKGQVVIDASHRVGEADGEGGVAGGDRLHPGVDDWLWKRCSGVGMIASFHRWAHRWLTWWWCFLCVQFGCELKIILFHCGLLWNYLWNNSVMSFEAMVWSMEHMCIVVTVLSMEHMCIMVYYHGFI